MITFLQNLINAVALGSLYSLFALGITLIFGVMRLVNFAHGELVMAAAFGMVLVPSWPFAPLVILGVVTAAVFALLTERVAFRPMRQADPSTLLIGSFAVGFLLQNLARLFYGPLPRSLNLGSFFVESWKVGDLIVPKQSVSTIATTMVLLVALTVFLRRTAVGLQMRAAAENFDMARLLGVRANTVISAAFVISGILAGATAVILVGQRGSVTVDMGLQVVLFGFIASVLGGLGSLSGAVVAGYLIGITSVMLQAYLPLDVRPWRDLFVYAAIFLTIAFRPNGLIGASTRVERI